MTNPSYTDEQVLAVVAQCLSRQIGAYEARVVRSLLADRQRLQAQCEAEAVVAGSYFDQIKQLQAEVEALRPDAERYRWLRDRRATVGIAAGLHCFDGPYFNREIHGAALDQAIDAARATPNETKEAKS